MKKINKSDLFDTLVWAIITLSLVGVIIELSLDVFSFYSSHVEKRQPSSVVAMNRHKNS